MQRILWKYTENKCRNWYVEVHKAVVSTLVSILMYLYYLLVGLAFQSSELAEPANFSASWFDEKFKSYLDSSIGLRILTSFLTQLEIPNTTYVRYCPTSI